VAGVRATSDAIAATAVNASSMNGAAPEVRSTHAAAVEAASTHTATMKSAAATEPAAAPAGERVIWNKARGHKHERCQRSKSVSKHGVPPVFAGVESPLSDNFPLLNKVPH
jgi:hypothetical protein